MGDRGYMTAYEIIIIVIMVMLGACFASFINAYALRSAVGVSNIKGRSNCPACGKTLTWYDLIPIISWLILLGKCSGCKKPISPRYLITEIVCAGASALVFIRYGISLMTPLAFGVIIILLAIALVDISTTEIPNGLILALIPFAIAAIWIRPEATLLDTLINRGIGIVAVSVPMFILAFMIGGFGGADVKLMAVCGFLLGWQTLLIAFFLGVLTGGAAAIIKLVLKKVKRKDQMVFGPYLCFGITAAMLYGDRILSLYEMYMRLF